ALQMTVLTLLMAAKDPLEKLDPDLKFLFDLADVAQQEAALVKQGGVNLGTLPAFIAQLAAKLDSVADPARKTALTAEYARLTAALDRVSGLIGKVPPEYWFLLEPLNSFQPTDSRSVSLPLFNVSPAEAAGGRYTLSLGAKASLTAQAVDQWPFSGDAV